MNKQDFKGGTPLHVASSEGQQKILNYFLEIRASGLDALDDARLTPSNFGTKWRISEGTHTSLGSRRKKRKSLLDVIAYRYIYCNGGAIDWVGSRYTRNYDGKNGVMCLEPPTKAFFLSLKLKPIRLPSFLNPSFKLPISTQSLIYRRFMKTVLLWSVYSVRRFRTQLHLTKPRE